MSQSTSTNDSTITSTDQRIGIVIPVYNRKRTLQKTLSFVISQTSPPEKVVIVDDGSTDGTANAVEAWLSREQRPFSWSVIRTVHRTAAAARNIGFKEVKDLPFIAFLDSDDHWPCDFLERTSSSLVNSPDSVAASVDRHYVDESARFLWSDDCSQLAADSVKWMFQNDAGIASCSLFRTEAIVRAGRWPESMESGEDLRLFVDIARLGRWLHSKGDPVRFHHGSAKSIHEEGNLSKRRVELYREWARLYEEIYSELTGCDPVRNLALQRAIAQKWEYSGVGFLQSGRTDEAAESFSSSLSWNGLAVGVRIRWALALFIGSQKKMWRSPR